jgi:PAS domain S-box-containing protein
MLILHLLSTLVISITVIWLWRQGRERGRMAHALYGLLAWEIGRAFWLQLFPLPANQATPLLYNLLLLSSWVILFWGLEQRPARILLLVVVGAPAVWLLPDLAVNVAGWGFLTAVPLASVAYMRQRAFPLPFLGPAQQRARPGANRRAAVMEPGMLEQQQPILECIADGVIVNSREGVIQYVNEAALAIVGAGSDSLIGRPMSEVLARLPMPTGQPANRNGDDGRVANQERFEMNGRIIQGQLNIIYNQSGEMQGTVTVLRDITAEYQSERAKNAFLTTISHELRTPLTAIKGYVELLVGGTAGPLNSGQKALAGPIQRNVTRMVQLINSLIFVSSVKGGKLEFTPGFADLRQLIDQTVREMQVLAEQNEQQIKVEIDRRLQPIQADPIHIATILHELIGNGLQYNRCQGEVRVMVNLEAGAESEQEFVVVSVSDNGIGIAPADQNHIFEDFFRPDLQDEQIRAGGMGVGLSIVRALVEAYGGRIWFESSLGQGSTFTFIIPRQQPDNIPHFPLLEEV